MSETQRRTCSDGVWSEWSGSFAHADCAVDGHASCGNAAHGSVQTRLRYAKSQVEPGEPCESETQERTCLDGQWSAWSGSEAFVALSCEVRPFFYCGGLSHGAVAERRTRYAEPLVANAEDCRAEEQTRVCEDRTLSDWRGTFGYESCEVELFGTCSRLTPCAEGECVARKRGDVARCMRSNGAACMENEECAAVCIGGVCTGRGELGYDCDDSDDCSSSDGVALACIAGRCSFPEGAPCEWNRQCSQACRDGHCAPFAAYGESCDDNSDCAEGLACATNGPWGPGVCKLAIGSLCSSEGECADGGCECVDARCAAMECTYKTACGRCQYRTSGGVFYGSAEHDCAPIAAGYVNPKYPCYEGGTCNGSGGCRWP